MDSIRRIGFWPIGIAAVFVALMIGLDAQPGDPRAVETDAPVLVTRAVTAPMPIDELSVEDGQPVLPAEQSEPTRFEFVVVEAPTPLVEGVEEIERPGAVQRVTIPRIGLDTDVAAVGLVAKGGELRYETPNFVPGQYSGVNPGEGSNVVIAGHVATHENAGGQIFGNLHKLILGDTISIETEEGLLEYVVSEIRFVGSTAVEIMEPTPSEQLTLITCRVCNVDCQRLVVIAKPTGAWSSVV